MQLFAAIHLDDIAVTLYADVRLSFDLTGTADKSAALAFVGFLVRSEQNLGARFGEPKTSASPVPLGFALCLRNSDVGPNALGRGRGLSVTVTRNGLFTRASTRVP